ncbi:beta-hexosaminidase subunit beta [Pieris rapae]|uniref:beta-hexosaminidase subunit beta n=1 Tax=Pieris rapae TaxID=64459 RepID=UPI001E281430|nr:beta-hexosaminidase subunit beta [Pieris rapae]
MLTACIFITLVSISACVEIPGPKFKPTKGEVWPKPKNENKSRDYYTFSPSLFNTKVTDKTCRILTRAVHRYTYMIQNDFGGPWSGSIWEDDGLRLGDMTTLEVSLTEPCEEHPSYGMNENYTLIISSTSKLESASVWGILRGLETFSQLLYYSDDYKQIRINKNNIDDSPSYIHRGLLLDTARHFISLRRILETLDAMSYNKMNVFHWHMVDDQSFPYQSEKYPELSEKGAYTPWMIYTKEDLQRVVEYARDRGIRVVPEFDVPGHTRSWGNSHPEILTECSGLGPMDPSNDATFNIVGDIYKELDTIFPDDHRHIGGDEVETSCWGKSSRLTEFIKEKGINVEKVQGLFMETLMSKLNDTKIIVWQEAFMRGVKLPKSALIQVWRWQEVEAMRKVLKAGYKVLFSTRYYLDDLTHDWSYLYKYDPRQTMLATDSSLNLDNIVGGETCMWTEKVNDANVISRVWPRASAFAERFWSGGPGIPIPSSHDHSRLEEHTCRMIKRGIEAEPPSGPGLC